MNRRLSRAVPKTLITSIVSILAATGCSCSSAQRSIQPPPLPQKISKRIAPLPRNASSPLSWKRLWLKTLPGFISDLNISADGKTLLISTLPDRETPGGDTAPALRMLDEQGKIRWKRVIKTTIRTQALSGDGKLAVVSTYDNEILAFDRNANPLWKRPGMCKPFILANGIVCFHDEDSNTDSVFEVLKPDGSPAGTGAKLAPDVETLSMKTSVDRNNFVVRLTRGNLQLYGGDFALRWSRTVAGELVDVGVSSGSSPQVAALYRPWRKLRTDPSLPLFEAERVALFSTDGNVILDTELPVQMEQIELPPEGRGFVLYGNGNEGQYLLSYDLPDPSKPIMRWEQLSEEGMDYSSSMLTSPRHLIMAFNDKAAPDRHSHTFLFDWSGQLRWNVELRSPENAFLYVLDFAEDALRLAAATDDRTLQLFQLNQ